MEYRFGVEVKFNGKTEIDDRLEIKISKETALIFIDGNNICSIYPKHLTEAEITEELKEQLNEYFEHWVIKPTEGKLRDAAKWIKEKIGG